MTFNDIPHVARYLMEKHNLVGWVFEWDNAKIRAGCCQYRRKTITLSRNYVVLNVAERFDDVIDTILHEIAHALAGPKAHHNAEWKDICITIGARPDRCYDSSTVAMPTGNLIAVCGGCGKKFTRFKRPSVTTYRYCIACGPKDGRLKFGTEQELAAKQIIPDTPPPPTKLR